MGSSFKKRSANRREQWFSPSESTILQGAEGRISARPRRANSIQLVAPQHLTAIARSVEYFCQTRGAVNLERTQVDRSTKRRKSLLYKRLRHFDAAAGASPGGAKTAKMACRETRPFFVSLFVPTGYIVQGPSSPCPPRTMSQLACNVLPDHSFFATLQVPPIARLRSSDTIGATKRVKGPCARYAPGVWVLGTLAWT